MSNLLKIEQAEVSTKHDSQVKHVIRVQDDYYQTNKKQTSQSKT